MKLMLHFVIIIVLFANTNFAYAQNAGADAGGANSENMFEDSMKDVYTVVGVGIGGAVLGLSTLSFAEEPKDNLKNVVTGGAIGIIVGVAIVAYKHATKSSTKYKENAYRPVDLKDFSTDERLRWHKDKALVSFYQKGVSIPQFTYQVSF